MMCMNVDLPDPDGPVTARNSPLGTSRFTPRNALTSTSPTTYVLTRFLTEITVDIVLSTPTAAAAGRSAAALRHQRVARAGGPADRARGADARHACHDFRVLLQFGTQQLG